MNRNDFFRIIHDSCAVDRQMIGEVRELLDLFPYFQSAHLLLLKGLHNTSDVKFESQLKQSAIFVADREVLYYLLKKEPQSAAEQLEIVKLVNPGESITTDNQQTVIESGKNSLELINEFEKNYRRTDGARNPESTSHGMQHSLLVTEESDEDDSANIVFLLDDEEELPGEKIIYMDPSILVSAKDDLLELDLQEEGSSAPDEGPFFIGVTEVVEKNSKKLVQTDLIDKFIISNPRIEAVKDKSNYPLEDISIPFTEENGGFITETLAKIYINQGYYSKAIDIYEKLSLKFPEKISYFATQIEKVKGLIK
jgi:tetratricopeptide (TPR) repeat protein